MEINKEEIEHLARTYTECLNEAINIPLEVFGPDKDFLLTREDYRQIATSIFIEYNQRNGSGSDRGRAAEDKLSTNPQQSHIAGLITNTGKEGEEITDQFLKNNHVESVDKLSKRQASSLIDLLHEEDRKRSR